MPASIRVHVYASTPIRLDLILGGLLSIRAWLTSYGQLPLIFYFSLDFYRLRNNFLHRLSLFPNFYTHINDSILINDASDKYFISKKISIHCGTSLLI